MKTFMVIGRGFYRFKIKADSYQEDVNGNGVVTFVAKIKDGADFVPVARVQRPIAVFDVDFIEEPKE